MSLPPCGICGDPEAFVYAPGTEGEEFMGMPLSLPVTTRVWCLACARAAGWPWLASEPPKRRRA